MVREMRDVCNQLVGDEQRWKEGEELVEGHAAALAEDVVVPGFEDRSAKEFGNGQAAERPEVGNAVLHASL